MSAIVRDLELHTLADVQRAFDTLYWSAPATLRGKQHHILLHLIGAIGKLARLEEREEHGERPGETDLREVIPDLLVYAVQLADLHGYELATLYRERLRTLAHRQQREDPWQGSPLLARELGSDPAAGRGS